MEGQEIGGRFPGSPPGENSQATASHHEKRSATAATAAVPQSEPCITAEESGRSVKGDNKSMRQPAWRLPCGSNKEALYSLRSVTAFPQPFAAPPPLFSPGCHKGGVLIQLLCCLEAPLPSDAPLAFGSLRSSAMCDLVSVISAHLQRLLRMCQVLLYAGCELLKTLCVSGFRDLAVLDLDVVAVSNLHRQFLFREEHVGKFKAAVAAEVLNTRFAHLGVRIEPTAKFREILCVASWNHGADTAAGCRTSLSLSSVALVSLLEASTVLKHDVERDSMGAISMETAPLLLDGGTEGLRGQMRFCIPGVTACYECGIGTLALQAAYPLCTIATTPRQPEHCVEYCLVVQWVKEHPDEQIDLDNPDHLSWLFAASKSRAEKFGIEGVTYRLTTGVAKRIVPAVSSTNAIVAALLVQEAFRFKTFCCCSAADRSDDGELENYIMYSGDAQTYMHTFALERNPDCLVCSRRELHIPAEKSWTLARLLEELQKQAHLNKPSIRGPQDFLFIQNPPSLREQHEWKLDLTIAELLEKGLLSESQPLFVTDPSFTSGIELFIFDKAQQ
ncbi:ubiquitin activating protein [Cyclospora cayetanensis]|uniref:NEDD8-activating enzyme E1 catalytic subunit n=1 Tax=Cyclospora cayetanensis TaxID=88456 RepID=A0A1D3CZ28_9EIME|nr:ubiquitin activating protein [Cyclospora cayetanensis]